MKNVYLVQFKLKGSTEPLATLGVFSSERAAMAEMSKLGFDYFTAIHCLPLNQPIIK